MLTLRAAYPIVFAGYRGFSPGITGLAFTGLAVGCFLVIGLEPVIRRMIDSHRKDPETGKVTPEAMVSVICIAAVMAPIGEIWFAWTCIPPVHWIWPILAGIPVRLFLAVTASIQNPDSNANSFPSEESLTCVPSPLLHVNMNADVSSIQFGAGNTTVFIYASNYLAQSYGSKPMIPIPYSAFFSDGKNLQSTLPQPWPATRSCAQS